MFTAKQINQFAKLEQAYETGTATAEETETYFRMIRKGYHNAGKPTDVFHSVNHFVDTDKHPYEDMAYLIFH